MYLYIYDSYLNDKKYQTVLTRIESRLADLGINGRIAKMTILKNMKETILDGIKKGAETIVAVGNDKTLFEVIRILAREPVTVGYIPVGTKSTIAPILDIPEEEKACDVLSARLSEKMDIGKVNNQYFLSSIEVDKGSVSIQCDGRYWVTSTSADNQIRICNLTAHPQITGSSSFQCNPQDGYLETVIGPPTSTGKIAGLFQRSSVKTSIFSARKLKIVSQSESVTITADGQPVAKTPVTVEVLPQLLKVIVGKKRMF